MPLDMAIALFWFILLKNINHQDVLKGLHFNLVLYSLSMNLLCVKLNFISWLFTMVI